MNDPCDPHPQVFANKVNLGFSDCEDLKPEQVLDLTPADLLVDSQTNLYAVKFTVCSKFFDKFKKLTKFVSKLLCHVYNLKFGMFVSDSYNNP